jgi:hypothetical protein
LAFVRLGNLRKLFRKRYSENGGKFTDDDAGREDLGLLLHQQAWCVRPDRRLRVLREVADQWAPFLPPDERDRIVKRIAVKPLKFEADTLGRAVNLIDIERTALRLWTIGAVDVTKAERLARRRQRDKEAAARRRRAAKKMTRPEYLASHTLSRTKPWVAEGISRRTWERRRQRDASPSSVFPIVISTADAPASPKQDVPKQGVTTNKNDPRYQPVSEPDEGSTVVAGRFWKAAPTMPVLPGYTVSVRIVPAKKGDR